VDAVAASSPTDQIAFLFVFSSVDLAAGNAPIENGNRCGASCAGRPIHHPDNNGCQPDEDDLAG
jgi:hypothetical protein